MDLLRLMSVSSRNQPECFSKRFLGECTNMVNVTKIFALVKYFCFHSHMVQLEVSKPVFIIFLLKPGEYLAEGIGAHTLRRSR